MHASPRTLLFCSIPVSAPVWSVAWSPLNSQQLLLGLDKGRIAVADIRKSSSQALLLTSNASNSCRPMQPLHSLLTLQPGQLGQLSNSSGDGPSWEAGAAPEAVVACAGMAREFESRGCNGVANGCAYA